MAEMPAKASESTLCGHEDSERQVPRRCGGPMVFVPDKGGLLCSYCDHLLSMAGETESKEKLDLHQAEYIENFSWGETQKQVICGACGAQTIYDALETSGVCPYCGSHQVTEEAVDTSVPPTSVVPFTITRNVADIIFRYWIKEQEFSPLAVQKEVQAETFKGIYLPFWSFDARAVSIYYGRYEKNRTERDAQGNPHTVSGWYTIRGTFSNFVKNLLVPASIRHDEKTIAELEPFDLAEAKPYLPEYLAGFMSERYSVGTDEGWKRGRTRMDELMNKQIQEEIKKSYGANSVRSQQVKTGYSNVAYKYMLLPVWMLSFRYRKQIYRVMINGQTGKVVGNAPVSRFRVAVAWLLVLLGLAPILTLYVLAAIAS